MDSADDDRVRAELSRLGDDAASAPEVPAAVTARVVSALRSQRLPRRAAGRPAVRLGAVVGVVAALAAVVLGSVTLTQSELAARTSAQRAAAEPSVPLSDDEIRDLLRAPRKLGPLDDPRRRASCLSGLGYPASTVVLGGREIEIADNAAVLLVLPGDTDGTVVALAVRPNCSSVDTGLLADTKIRQP